MNSMKKQKDRKLKDELPDAQYAIGEEERMERLSQSKNSNQLWMGLVMEAKSDAVKSNIT